jgi:hypothetical protein
MRPVVLALAIASAIALGACSPTDVDSTPAPAPLVTITTRGGECPEGPCGSIIVIEHDGRLHQTAPAPKEIGTIPPARLAAIDAAIKATDFGVMRLRRSTERCAVDVDGQEVIYDFSAPTGIERIRSCETQIDPQHPAFATVRDGLRAGGMFSEGP